jgi:TadE-like protein
VRRRARGDAGTVGAVELVIVTPILVTMIFGVVQMALCWHARNIVQATAEEASRIATAADGTCAQAEAEGVTLGRRLGGSFLDGAATVRCTDGATVVVTVQADALSILPGFDFPVRARTETAAPRER